MLLVTGGAGFIGSNVVAPLNDSGRADVAVCDLLGKLSARYAGLPVTLVLDNARYQKCEVVRSLAARLADPKGITPLMALQ